MDIVFVSGVELGQYALKGIVDSKIFVNGNITIKAIFTHLGPSMHPLVGYELFAGIANSIDCPLERVSSIKSDDAINRISAYKPDLLCIIGWSELAPARLLDVPKMKHGSSERHSKTYGSIGIHPTMLPEGRGRAPIPWTIIKGLKKSGVTLFYLEEEADTGDIIAQYEYGIKDDDDAGTIYDKVKHLHYALMGDNISLLQKGIAPRLPQDHSKATLWPRRRPDDGAIDWSQSQEYIHNWIRALTYPYPGTFTFWHDLKIRCWRSWLGPKIIGSKTGSVINISNEGIIIACSNGLIILDVLQMEDGIVYSGKEFAENYNLSIGDLFLAQKR